MGTHDPWDGTGWDTTSPDNFQVAGNMYKEAYDLRKGVGIRCGYEHTTFASSSAGGIHKNGAAVCYEGTSTPTNRPDGSTALADNAYDRGRLWIDDNYDLPVLKRWAGSAFECVTAHIVHATSAVLEIENLEDANTDGAMDSIIKFVGYKDAAGDTDLAWIRVSHDGTSDDQKGKVEILVNDGDDGNTPSKTGLAIGSDQLVEVPGALTVTGAVTNSDTTEMTGNVTVNTNKVTIDASNGNTAIAGTLGVTGVATLGDGSANASSAAPTADAQLANKKYVDDKFPDDDAFGTWASKSNNTVYQAASDGFVCAYSDESPGTQLQGYTDNSNPPTTLRARTFGSGSGSINYICFPVRKNDYWKVVNAITIYWLPVGG